VITAVAAAVLFATAPTRVLTGVTLHDSTVMQSMAWDGQAWIFAQLQQDGRGGRTAAWHSAHGDLTLTRTGPAGGRLGYMFLDGFGHGVSIDAQRDSGGVWVWTETAAVGGYGTRIARFRWQPGLTLTPGQVQQYAPEPGGTHQTPSLVSGLAGVRYTGTDGRGHVAVYSYTGFTARRYAAVRNIPQPPLPGTFQGWSLLPAGAGVAWLSGDSASTPPGNMTVTTTDDSGTVVSRDLVTVDAGLVFREPEGLTVKDGHLCAGIAYGEFGAKRANVYCW
jgi:hypothetical protein